MEATKSPIELIELVNAGEVNPLEAYIILKQELASVETALKAIQSEAYNEACKYGEKSFKAFGASIELRSGASTFKFSETIQQMEARLKLIKEQSKLGEFADPDTGVIIEQAVKIPGKDTLAISFK